MACNAGGINAKHQLDGPVFENELCVIICCFCALVPLQMIRQIQAVEENEEVSFGVCGSMAEANTEQAVPGRA